MDLYIFGGFRQLKMRLRSRQLFSASLVLFENRRLSGFAVENLTPSLIRLYNWRLQFDQWMGALNPLGEPRI